MNDDIISLLAIVLALLALAIASAVLIRAWLASRAKRRRLAAAYDRVSTRDRAQLNGMLERKVWPRPPLQPPGDGGPFKRSPEPEPLRPAYSSRSTDEGYTPPSFPADPSPAVFGEPVSLSSTAFEGDGGSFGGAGASGSWDAPSSGDSGGGFSDSGGTCDSGSSGGDSGGGCSND